MPTPFDWRVGVLDGEPLYVCKYYMVDNHWQIDPRRGRTATGGPSPGRSRPPDVLRVAARGRPDRERLYGVDVKEVRGRALVVEVNDNPNIDAGIEDAVLQDELYLRIMRLFLKRLESRGR